MAVKVTSERRTYVMGGKEYCITVTWYEGLDTYIHKDGSEVLCDLAICTDYGEKCGRGWDYVWHKGYTQAQRAEGQRQIQAVAVQSMVDQDIW